MDKMIIVWICSLSNPAIRNKLRIHQNKLEPLMMRVVKREKPKELDSAIWNTNGINEMKNISHVELHVICPIRDLAEKRQDFTIDGVYYHFFRDENSPLYKKVLRFLFTKYSSKFKINRKTICGIVQEINPDLVHVIGAENPHYSLALLDLPKSIPTILQLQALLASIADKTTGKQNKEYSYKAKFERQLIQHADYVGTKVPSFITFIREEITPDVKIVDTSLAMGQTINISRTNTEYDFVHYAAQLGPSKATDVAIEAFGLACQGHPGLTLDVIGGISGEFRTKINRRIEELGITSAVTFEGLLPTHDDVITQIRKAKCALLPLAVSIVPNTLHEAMANGLPVITTVTPGTPSLNYKRESVLISPQGDVNDLASNMVRLIEHEDLYEMLRRNAAITELENDNNKDIINHWVEVYETIIRRGEDGVKPPDCQ